jgi:uncharacterized damage-inducible protein DinB
MAIKDGILPEFDREIEVTRRVLERVPEGKPEFKPHERSMALDRLAGHVAELPGWAKATILADSIEMGKGASEIEESLGGPLKMTSRKQLLEEFDKRAAAGRAAIAGASDEAFMKPWSLVADGKAVFTMPKIAVLRGFVMNHLIHHRGQLSVYLRLNNVPVPSIYGPSADEQTFASTGSKSEAAKN